MQQGKRKTVQQIACATKQRAVKRWCKRRQRRLGHPHSDAGFHNPTKFFAVLRAYENAGLTISMYLHNTLTCAAFFPAARTREKVALRNVVGDQPQQSQREGCTRAGGPSFRTSVMKPGNHSSGYESLRSRMKLKKRRASPVPETNRGLFLRRQGRSASAMPTMASLPAQVVISRGKQNFQLGGKKERLARMSHWKVFWHYYVGQAST